jgi:phosphoribosylformylglycinamidine synthase
MTRESKKDLKEGKEPKAKSFRAQVFVSLKPTVNDPEGNTISSALGSLGFEGVTGVRSGRYFQVLLQSPDAKKAGKQVDQMCSRLLANPVIETYRFEIAEA